MLICHECNNAFSVPGVDDNGEVCPFCGSYDFLESDTCPKCNEWKESNENLCKVCRSVLLARFKDFADGLTAEEEQQLDDWLDGESITNRNRWKP